MFITDPVGSLSEVYVMAVKPNAVWLVLIVH